MKKTFLPIPLAASLLLLGTGTAWAQAPAAAASDSHSSHHTEATAAPTPQADLSEGEITRWDPRTLRLTLKHGEIKNLEMPPMTMVFRVADASVVGDLKPGDKVRFRAEQVSGAYHVQRIEKAP
ncbi:copper-binding protein [Acidovorax kalamii]|uniref:copper-binding protein n=1 Tax=Acidovorax kalamii TaxID=2004485 RepID=UPI00209142A1|nr:copper-binding protein [Acidovorax kalamii]MCO5355031.1 copper-binding protein [Acidovorax kalamii]